MGPARASVAGTSIPRSQLKTVSRLESRRIQSFEMRLSRQFVVGALGVFGKHQRLEAVVADCARNPRSRRR